MMLTCLLLLVTAVGYIAGSDDSLDIQLDFVDQQLNTLTNRMLSLSSKLDGVLADSKSERLRARFLTQTLNRHEGKNGACKKGFFPCDSGQYGAVQCVRDYLVCDGSADCKYGADEADDVCGWIELFRRPAHMRGQLVFDHCGSEFYFSEQVIGLRPCDWSWSGILSVIPWFPSKPELNAHWVGPVQSKAASTDIYTFSKPVLDPVARRFTFPDNEGNWEAVVEELEEGKLRVAVYGYRLYHNEPCYLNVYSEA